MTRRPSNPRPRHVTTMTVAGAAVSLVAAAVAAPIATAGPSRPAAGSTSGLNTRIEAMTVAPKSTDAWAVTSVYQAPPSTAGDRVIRYHHGRWSKVAVKHLPTGTLLNAVAAGSSKRIWLAGDRYDTATSQQVPFLAQSTGGAFKPVTSVKLGTGSLIALAASSPKNAWLVEETTSTTTDVIFHWNGHGWKRMVLPPTSAAAFSRASISTSSPSNVWLVADGTGGTTVHWDGHHWKEWPVPAADEVNSIVTTGSHTWVVGYTPTPSTSPVALRRQGTSWRAIPIPQSKAVRLFTGVTAAGSTAYAVGYRNTDASFDAVPIVYRLKGKAATVLRTTAVGKYSSLDTAAASSKLIVAGGRFETTGYCASPFHPLVERLHASSWKQLKIPAKVAPAGNTGQPACG